MLSDEGLGELQIVLSTVFFGLSFVGMRVAATNGEDELGPVTFQCFRCFVSFASLVLVRNRMKKRMNTDVDNYGEEENEIIKSLKQSLSSKLSGYSFDLLFFGSGCGLLTFLVSVCQQTGVETLSAGKAAFINGLFVVITPLIEHILPCYKKDVPNIVWFAVVLVVFGMYFLAYPQGTTVDSINITSSHNGAGGFPVGVIWLLLSTIFTSVDIMFSDAGAKRVDAVDFTLVMFAASTVIAFIVSVAKEFSFWSWPMVIIRRNWLLILFVGVTEGIGYTCGSLGQMYIPCHRAALLYSLEGLFTCILGYFLIGEALTYREILGCMLLMIGTVVSISPEVNDTEGRYDESDKAVLLPTTNDSNENILLKVPNCEKNEKHNYGALGVTSLPHD